MHKNQTISFKNRKLIENKAFEGNIRMNERKELNQSKRKYTLNVQCTFWVNHPKKALKWENYIRPRGTV